LSEQEHFNLFDLQPMTQQDIYFNKLQAGSIKTAIIGTIEGKTDRDIQTEAPETNDVFCNAPNDFLVNYQNQGNFLKQQQYDSFVLNLFVENTFPPMLKLVKENQKNYEIIAEKENASKSNAVDVKCKLEFPKQFLYLFSENGQQAQVIKVSCMHMFESAPQQKIAIAYKLVRPSGEEVNLVLIFQVKTNMFSEILYVDHEVTQMCTSGNPNVLIVATVVGTLTLFDLSKPHCNTSINSKLNHYALLEVSVKDFANMDPTKQEAYLV
jgi:hypothetical protein